MAQQLSEDRKRQRIETAVQGSFHCQPREEAVGLPNTGHVAGQCSIRRSVNGESQANSVLVERARQKLKVAGEENRDCQCDMNCGGE